jgi:hypothetical protein
MKIGAVNQERSDSRDAANKESEAQEYGRRKIYKEVCSRGCMVLAELFKMGDKGCLHCTLAEKAAQEICESEGHEE